MYRVLLNLAGAINLSIGFLILLAGILFGNVIDDFFALIPIIIIFATGGVFIYAANKRNLERSFSKFVLVSSLCNIFICNIISLILGILGYCNLSTQKESDNVVTDKDKKMLTPEEKEIRKMRNILGLGVGLVVLAGVIFATSTWETLTGSMKTIILVFSAILFYLVSVLAEKKLSLKVSGMMYYALSNVLIIVSILSAGYFEVFGNWFSLNGNGSNLFFAVIWLFVGVLSGLAYVKYELKNILYLVYFSIISFIYFGVLAIGIAEGIAFSVISIVISVGAVYKFSNRYIELFNKFCKVILPIFTVLLFVNIMLRESNIIFYMISFLVYSIAGYYLALVDGKEFFKVFAPIAALINAVAISLVGDTSSKVMLLQVSIISLGVYSIGYYKRDDKLLYNVSSVIANFAWLYVVFDAIDLKYYYLSTVVALVLLGTSVIVSLDKSSDRLHYEKVIEPIKILILAYSVYMLLRSFEFMDAISFGIVISIIFLIMYLVRKDLFKFIYFIISCFTTLIIFISNINAFAHIEHILTVIISLVLLMSVCFSNERKYVNFSEAIYSFFILSIFIMFRSFADEYEKMKLICILGTLLSYIVAFLFVSRNNIMKLMTILAVFIPYYWALENIVDVYIMADNFRFVRNIEYIFLSIPWLFMIVIYTKGFLKSIDGGFIKIIETIFLSIWYIVVLTRVSSEIALFVGIVALVSILVGYRSEKYVAFYYTGIVFTVLNLLVQLKDIWRVIPVWAYILIAGLILIGVVTYKEYVKINSKPKEVIPDIIEPGSKEVKKSTVDNRTVLIGNIIYGIILVFSFINIF